MKYLEDHYEKKEDPQKLMTEARTAILICQKYLPHPEPETLIKEARVALYAQGQDYHFWFKEKLQKVCLELKKKFPNFNFQSFSDSSPVLERDLAYQASLGWFGKNTCLIHRKQGSLFFIGEIYTDLSLSSLHEPIADFCGKCTKCIDACPTEALIEPHVLDARKCISYLTIESKEVPPVELRKKIGSWFFGCDICQTVCPWNHKVFGKFDNKIPNRKKLIEELEMILTTSGKKLTEKLKFSPLVRARPFGLKRNALIIIGNENLFELKPLVETYLADDRLGELAQWTLSQLNPDPVS